MIVQKGNSNRWSQDSIKELYLAKPRICVSSFQCECLHVFIPCESRHHGAMDNNKKQS